MPANIVDVSAFTSPVVTPSDGDAADAASVAQAVQPLADRTRYLLNGLLSGAIAGSGVDSDGTQINVRPFSAVISGKRYDVALTVVPLAGLTPNSWYYVYYDTGAGCLLSANAPDTALQYENGNAARLYLCAVRALSGTTVRAFRYTFGSRFTQWRLSAVAGSLTIASGTPGSYQDCDCTAWMPPHARNFEGYVEISDASSTTSPIAEWRTKGDTTGAWRAYGVKLNAVSASLKVETNSSNVFEVRTTSGASGTTNWIVSPVGFRE